jgi:hypothetical protein
MNNLITEQQNNEISRILEIMKIEKNIISEGRIGRELAEKIWKEFKKLDTVLRREYRYVNDSQWRTIFNAIEKDEIYTLQEPFQKELARIIKSKKDSFIPEIYKSVVESWFKDNPKQNYTEFIKILKDAQNVRGGEIEDILTTGDRGKAVFKDINGNPDFFSIELLASRIQKDIDNLKNKRKLEYPVDSLPKTSRAERLANDLDKTKWAKYTSIKALYEGMLRNEPGAQYFLQWLKTKVMNPILKKKGKSLITQLTDEEFKIAMRWFATGVADWNQVRRVSKTLGWYNVPVNIAGQLIKKWAILTLLFSGFSMGKAIAEGMGEDGKKMSVPKGFWKKIVGEFESANIGLTSPMLRIFDFILFNLVSPLLEGGFSKERLIQYFDGELNRWDILLGRVEKGENIQDETVQRVIDSVPTFDTTGVPMPNPQTDPLSADSIRTGAVRDSTASSEW